MAVANCEVNKRAYVIPDHPAEVMQERAFPKLLFSTHSSLHSNTKPHTILSCACTSLANHPRTSQNKYLAHCTYGVQRDLYYVILYSCTVKRFLRVINSANIPGNEHS